MILQLSITWHCARYVRALHIEVADAWTIETMEQSRDLACYRHQARTNIAPCAALRRLSCFNLD